MYVPRPFVIEDRHELLAVMRANPFALLVTTCGGLEATHLPVIVEERAGEPFGVIRAHLAKANPQVTAIGAGGEAMVVFSGPHAYVSPRWYEQAERVPTWNYAAVHAYGRVRVLEERAAKHAAVAKLVAAHDPQWRPAFEALRAEYVDSMLGAIVAFEIEVTRIEARWKLSQNRGRREQERIAAELEKSPDGLERALAALTRRHLVPE